MIIIKYFIFLICIFILCDKYFRYYIYVLLRGFILQYEKFIIIFFKAIFLFLFLVLYYFFTLNFENIIIFNISENINEALDNNSSFNANNEKIEKNIENDYYEKVTNFMYEKRYYIIGSIVIVTGILVIGYLYIYSGGDNTIINSNDTTSYSDVDSGIENVSISVDEIKIANDYKFNLEHISSDSIDFNTYTDYDPYFQVAVDYSLETKIDDIIQHYPNFDKIVIIALLEDKYGCELPDFSENDINEVVNTSNADLINIFFSKND